MPTAPAPLPSHRLLFSILPAAVIAIVGVSALWGDSGLFVRESLRAKLASANEDLAALERENQRLVRELKILEEDPLAIERLIAEELELAAPGATLYRFRPDDKPPSPPGDRKPPAH